MDKTFLCPYCGHSSIKLSEHMYCGVCFAEMRSGLVGNVKHAVRLSGGQDLYSGLVGAQETHCKFVAPASASNSIFRAKLYAIFPAKGLGAKSPLVVLQDFPSLDDEQSSRLDAWRQAHPQLDSPFDRFFKKGMLYSGIGNAIAIAFLEPPVWMFWLFLFGFAFLYYYYSRKIPISFADRLKINNLEVSNER